MPSVGAGILRQTGSQKSTGAEAAAGCRPARKEPYREQRTEVEEGDYLKGGSNERTAACPVMTRSRMARACC